MDQSEHAAKIFGKYAESYASKYQNIGLYQDSIDQFLNFIDVNVPKILELACGPGNVSSYLKERKPSIQLIATDFSEKMVDQGKKEHPHISFLQLDMRKSMDLAQNFDAIICAFGFPYINKKEAIQCIENFSIQLTSNGLVYLSTILGLNENSELKTGSQGDQLFMNYHEASYLLDAFQINQFTIILEKTLVNPLNGDEEIVIIARKNCE